MTRAVKLEPCTNFRFWFQYRDFKHYARVWFIRIPWLLIQITKEELPNG